MLKWSSATNHLITSLDGGRIHWIRGNSPFGWFWEGASKRHQNKTKKNDNMMHVETTNTMMNLVYRLLSLKVPQFFHLKTARGELS